MNTHSGYGHGGRSRTIVLTFDNLGEASAIERGTWSPETPLGEDASVTEALPRLLDTLAAERLTATFFVEAINSELNPRALHEISARGHEVGVHGWGHEPWGELDAAAEDALLRRATAAMRAIGVTPRGFRPPGGALTPRTPELLRELGYTWVSPEGDSPAVDDGLARIPFRWNDVDAYHLMDRFADLRARRGDAAAALAPAQVGDRLSAALRDPHRGVTTIVLHAFLMLNPAWWTQVRELLALIAGLAGDGDGDAWVGPGADLAPWLT